MAKIDRRYILSGLSGLLAGLAYTKPYIHMGSGFDFGFMVWVSLIPLFYVLFDFQNNPQHNLKLKEIFLSWFCAGFVYFLFVFRWLISLYPLADLGVSNPLNSIIIIFLIYTISAAGMAVFWGLFGLLIPNLNRRKLVLIVPAVFVLMEYAASYGFGILWLGSGTFVGPHWTFGNFAYSLANNQFALKLASYLGIYGVTFLIVLINYLIFIMLSSDKLSIHKKIFYSALVVSSLSVLPFYIQKLASSEKVLIDTKKITFSIIQTNDKNGLSPSPKESLESLREQLSLLNKAAKSSPDDKLVLFPEASEIFKDISLFLKPSEVKKYFTNLFKEPALIVAGGRVVEGGEAYSRVFNLDSKEGPINYYDKRLLAPGGEFLPYPIKTFLFLFSKISNTNPPDVLELKSSSKTDMPLNFRNEFKTSVLICSELWSQDLTRKSIKDADIILGMASYSMFHGNSALQKQVLAVNQFRASENSKPLIMASNMGISYALGSNGKLLFLTPDESPQILTGAIAITASKSWYNKLGDMPIFLASLLLMLSLNSLKWFKR